MASNLSGPNGPIREFEPHHPRQVVFSGYTVLVARHDGGLRGEHREGLYDFDTRILSRHRLTIAGETPDWVASGTGESDRWMTTLLLRRGGGDILGPVLPQDGIELVLSRRIGRGMEERWTVHNHSMAELETELVLELEADFADVQEVEGERRQNGQSEIVWDATARALVCAYRVECDGNVLDRALRMKVESATGEVVHDERGLRFALRVAPHGVWEARLTFASRVDGVWREPQPTDPKGLSDRDRQREAWRQQRARVESSSRVFTGAWNRAAEDLWALRNWELELEPSAWVPNAGVPTYTGFFGRDTLTAGWQAALVGPEMMRGALAVGTRFQATEDSAWHDEEPGKIVHEMRRGPLAELGIIPHRAYYGTVTSSAMFVLALSELWHWTGDAAALRRYRDTALRTFEWAERYGDGDGDGFIEYHRRSSAGLKNHAWKDSDEAIRYADGSLVPNPIATCEEQAYHLIAIQRMAEVLTILGDDDRAAGFLERARDLAQRWHDAFWLEDEGFYAIALDPDKRPVRSIASNAGHALAAGIVPAHCARRVADRLMAPDLFSGWGIRTLSTEHPSYNPWAYHLGTIWPVENVNFALGFKRYGFDEHLERLLEGLVDAAARFPEYRLPEAIAGHARDEVPFPSAYPSSNSPQAWSASAFVHLAQVMLGIYPVAAAKLVALVRPRLPEWLPEITLERIRVGSGLVSLRFHRERDGTASYEVLAREGDLRIVTIAPPNEVAENESPSERIKRFAFDHAPGVTARALRIALGDMST